MPTVYPSGYDTATAGSLPTNKVNKEPIVDNTIDVNATEIVTAHGAILALEHQLGDGSSILSIDGDVDEGNVREIMDFMLARADRAGFHEHFVASSTSLPANTVSYYVDTIAGGANPAFATVAGGTGVSSQTAAIGARTGLMGTDNHFHFYYTYYRCRFHLDTIAFGPWQNGDQIDLGLWLDLNNYIRFRCTAAGGVLPDWDYEIYDGGAGTSDTLTGSAPAAGEWHVAEILTTTAGAYFFVDRLGQGGYTEYSSGIYTGTAPHNGQCRPYASIELAAGGAVMSLDAMSCQDTRTL
jgi:hypothetical protein